MSPFTYYVVSILLYLFAVYVQVRLYRTVRRYSKIPSSLRLQANEFVTIVSKKLQLHLKVEETGGYLADHYDSKRNIIRLSKGVFSSDSIAAIGIAAHELGHAIQKKEGYLFLVLRNLVARLVPFGTQLGYLLIIFGLVFNIFSLAKLGLFLFTGLLIFTIVTLPVEFDASKKALKLLETEFQLPSDEVDAIRRVLNAAALTYVAAFVSALFEFLYYASLVLRASEQR